MIETVRAASPIQAIVKEYGVELKPKGSTLIGLCPFHSDHTPSLVLNVEHQSFKCWACGVGGDVYTFVMQHENCNFQEALRLLAERSDISVGCAETRADLYRDAELYASAIKTIPKEVRQYIESRGITEKSIQEFGIGYDDGIIPAPHSLGLSDGLYRPMKKRIVFPIRDFKHRIVAFGGRIGPAEEKRRKAAGVPVVKYWNTPETEIFSKRRTLYGSAGKAEWVGVVEGYIDVVACRQRGLNVVAPLGTSVTDEHLSLLRRLGDEVVLIFDGDEAGRKGADRALNLLLQNSINTSVMMLPDGADPSDVDISTFQRHDPLDYAMLRCESFGLETIVGAQKASEYLAEIAGNLQDSVRISKAVTILAKKIGIPKETVMNLVKSKKSRFSAHRVRDFIDVEVATIALNNPDIDIDLEVDDGDVAEILAKRKILKSRGVRPTIAAMSRELGAEACSFAAGLIGQDCTDRIEDTIKAAKRRSMERAIDSAKRSGADIGPMMKKYIEEFKKS